MDVLKKSKNQKLSQKERIIDFLRHKKEWISRIESITELGIIELPARICELKQQGFQFEQRTKKGIAKYGYTFECEEYKLIE